MVPIQKVSSRYLKLARDSSLWREKCFDKSPCAVTSSSGPPSAALAYVLGTSPLQENDQDSDRSASEISKDQNAVQRLRSSKYTRAIAKWDLSHSSEDVDWYSEYIGRNGTIQAHWHKERQDVCGLAVSADARRVVGPLEDGSLCIWDIRQEANNSRAFRETGRSAAGVLFEDRTCHGEASSSSAKLAFSGVGECIALNSDQRKAYVAVAEILNEIDLETMQVVSQNRYAWPITALSQEDSPERPLTLGTNWSLHLHDTRVQFRERSRSPEDILKGPSSPEECIAILPDFTKGIPRRYEPRPAKDITIQPLSSFAPASPRPPRAPRRSTLSSYARCEPGPLSIIHQGPDNIFMAGRFPSILAYDRRYFPRLQYVIHSGARLSSLATTPGAPSRAAPGTTIEATLLAAGEYNGRGSMEIYSLPHVKQSTNQRRDECSGVGSIVKNEAEFGSAHDEQALSDSLELVDLTEPYNYKNRQAAATSKLLSVAAQGTRIVCSDAEGNLKWVERDGYGLVRRWNINSFEMHGDHAGVSGEQVVRKLVPVDPPGSERGIRGDGDLLVWTGEKIGFVSTHQTKDEVDELGEAFEEKLNCEETEAKAEEYSRVMRRALEGQANERRWMSRFNVRYR